MLPIIHLNYLIIILFYKTSPSLQWRCFSVLPICSLIVVCNVPIKSKNESESGELRSWIIPCNACRKACRHANEALIREVKRPTTVVNSIQTALIHVNDGPSAVMCCIKLSLWKFCHQNGSLCLCNCFSVFFVKNISSIGGIINSSLTNEMCNRYPLRYDI